MSVAGTDWRAVIRRLRGVLFGDRVGLAMWLGLVVAITATWRIGFFITDTYAVANALVNVAGGSLVVTDVPYAPTILSSQPGLHESGGQLYGRNYGQVFLAVPFVWILQVVTSVAPLSLVLAAVWSLGILAFADQLATVVDRDGLRVVGSVVALGSFGVNALGSAQLDPELLPLVALQLSTVFVAAFAGVLCYRLVGVFHHERVAIPAGVAVVAVLPLGFWAAIPKRHVLVATLVLAAVYCFARSRQATGRRAYLSLAGAYAFVSLVAWTHAFEGFFAVVGLVTVDVLTGGVRDRNRLVAIATGLAVGLAPMFLTNTLITGNPLEPPRMLPTQGAVNLEFAPTGELRTGDASGSGGVGAGIDDSGAGSSAGDGGSGDVGTDGDGQSNWNPLAFLAPLLGPVWTLLDRISFVVEFVVRFFLDGVAVLGDPERLWHIFGRSGRIDGVRYGVNQWEMIDLTFVESAPLLAGAVATPLFAAKRLAAQIGNGRPLVRPWDLSPRHQVDLLVAVLASLLTVVYLSRLPLHTQITVRYLVHTMPLWLYLVIRLPPVRDGLQSSPRRLALGYGFTLVAGIVAVAATLSALDVAIGEAMQFHALLNLGAGAVFVAVVVGRAVDDDGVPVQWLTTTIAVVAGLTTVFLILAGVEYFPYGPFALDLTRWLSNAIPIF